MVEACWESRCVFRVEEDSIGKVYFEDPAVTVSFLISAQTFLQLVESFRRLFLNNSMQIMKIDKFRKWETKMEIRHGDCQGSFITLVVREELKYRYFVFLRNEISLFFLPPYAVHGKLHCKSLQQYCYTVDGIIRIIQT